jgi:enoyl-CoA hydratase/carnithine racemase
MKTQNLILPPLTDLHLADWNWQLSLSELPDNARMGLPEVFRVIPAGYGGTFAAINWRAMEMIMTAGMVTADEPIEWDWWNHVVPQAELWNFAKEWHKNRETPDQQSNQVN